MFPFLFAPQPEGGRQEKRRKRRSSSSSPSRRCRHHKMEERGRSRRRARSSTSPLERKGKKRSRESPVKGLPPARAGYAWVQVPLPGSQPSPPLLQAPPAQGQQEGWIKQDWQPASLWQGQQSTSAWQGQQSSSSWQGHGQSSWHRGARYQTGRSSQWQHKGWNKWTEAASHAEGFPPPPPPPPQEGDQDRYNIREATPEEEAAEAQRNAAQEEESYHKQLWDQAIQTAAQDPKRPRSAHELVREGKLRDWWSMTWKDCRGLVDNDLQEMYLKKLHLSGHGSSEGGVPDVVIQRLSYLCLVETVFTILAVLPICRRGLYGSALWHSEFGQAAASV